MFIIRVVMPVRLAVIFTMNAVEWLSLLSPLPFPPLWKLHVSHAPLDAFQPAAPNFKVPKSIFQTRKIDRFSDFAKAVRSRHKELGHGILSVSVQVFTDKLTLITNDPALETITWTTLLW